jgi:hypothetical protein
MKMPMASITEAELRDRLASDISVLGSGLTLLEKEQYIPNPLGTRSFIDLYAKDQEGHHVLIELKRSDAAAREALHEIYKYIEAVKAHLGVRDNELIVMLASTEWRELLVPFSRFLAETKDTVRGIQLSVDDETGQLTAAPAPTIPISKGRFIAPWHEVYWYKDTNSMTCGVKTIQDSLDEKGVLDYVIAILKPPAPISSEHQAGMHASIQQLAEMQGLPKQSNPPPLPKYEYAAYVAMQMLTEEQYLQLLRCNPDTYAEVAEYLSEESDEERLLQLHEAVSAMEPRPTSDHFEIGYPAKLGKFLDANAFHIYQLVREGLFARNTLLEDAAIISELRGEDGSTGQRFKRSVSIANRSHVVTAKREIASCLEQNTAWRNHILRALSEIEGKYPAAEVDISIYNPQAGIFTIYFTATRQDGILFVPSYSLLVKNPEPIQMYYGALQSEGNAASFRAILKKYYDDDLGQLLFAMTWGGRDDRDEEILEDLGALYRSFRCDINGSRRQFFALRDDRWRECGKVDNLSLWSEYLQKNEMLVSEIVQKIGDCDHGNHFESINSRLIIEKASDVSKGEARGIYFHGSPERCDLCGCPLSEETYMIRGNLKNQDASAIMCADCFVVHGQGLGVGIGHLYHQHQGRWLQIGGFD